MYYFDDLFKKGPGQGWHWTSELMLDWGIVQMQWLQRKKSSCWEREEDPSSPVGECKLVKPLWRTVWRFLKK